MNADGGNDSGNDHDDSDVVDDAATATTTLTTTAIVYHCFYATCAINSCSSERSLPQPEGSQIKTCMKLNA